MRRLTELAMASSSGWRKRFEALCCLRACWLFRGVGEGRAAPAPKLLPPPRRCPKLSPVAMELGCVGAGESWPEAAEALDDVATAGGLDDIAGPPGRARAMTLASGCRGRWVGGARERAEGKGTGRWLARRASGRRVAGWSELGAGGRVGPPDGMDLGEKSQSVASRHDGDGVGGGHSKARRIAGRTGRKRSTQHAHARPLPASHSFHRPNPASSPPSVSTARCCSSSSLPQHASPRAARHVVLMTPPAPLAAALQPLAVPAPRHRGLLP